MTAPDPAASIHPPYRTAGRPHDRFAVWAPKAERVRWVVGDDEHDLPAVGGGWYAPPAELADRYPGEVDYGYRLGDDDAVLPDPRSRWQPDGVHGRSRTFDPTVYAWGDQAWTGRQLAGGVVYELHLGTFTPAGTLDSAIERLDHLVGLGIDFVELLPVNAFNGTHNWGYDGVGWFAVQHTYGGPAAYQRFVDACHQRGIGVIQDVVYNHFGPSGNYLPAFGPYLSDSGGASTWGAHVNLDGKDSDEVRGYILDNVLMWLRDHHVDGLRLDAVHALADHTAVHLLEELAVEVDALSAHVGRPLTLIAESDLNDPRLITPREAGGYGLTGQWSDDFHHAVITNLSGDTTGWFADFAGPASIERVLSRGFFHDGETSSFRGRRHGRPLALDTTPTWRLVVCTANHDQIGNRADGSRPSSRLSSERLALAATLCLLSPFTPMLFMGEEWGATTPWAFFTSHPEPDLGRATAEGRLAEFVEMDWDPATVPDPQDPATFERSHLDWDEAGGEAQAALLEHHRRLIALRRSEPAITDPRFAARRVTVDDGLVRIDAGPISVVANLSGAEVDLPAADATAERVVEVGAVGGGAGAAGAGALRLGVDAHVVLRRAEAPRAERVRLGGHQTVDSRSW